MERMTPYPKPTPKEKKVMTSAEFRRKYSTKDIKPRKDKLKSKTSPQKRFYSSTAWIWFARYMKLKYSDNQGMVRCATSGVPMSISDKELHLGHCIRVFESNNTQMNTAFNEKNVLPQSSRENRYYGGRPEVMRDKIDQTHGEGTYLDLVEKSKQFKKYTDSELKELAHRYREKTYERLRELGLKKWW